MKTKSSTLLMAFTRSKNQSQIRWKEETLHLQSLKSTKSWSIRRRNWWLLSTNTIAWFLQLLIWRPQDQRTSNFSKIMGILQTGIGTRRLSTRTSSTDQILDSHHLTSDLHNMTIYRPYNGDDSVVIGDGSGFFITHMGSISLSSHTRPLNLHKVLGKYSEKLYFSL